VIDQPILRERWIGVDGKQTTLKGQEISVRSCNLLAQTYLYVYNVLVAICHVVTFLYSLQ
jgi:inositol-phosphate phosphatase/L-galactose 1-phosphate phosphatase/histidinol-phosphatase